MTYYHKGAVLGLYSAMFLLPETQSAVVVLTNSFALNDAPNWISQVFLSTLLSSSKVGDYIEPVNEKSQTQTRIR